MRIYALECVSTQWVLHIEGRSTQICTVSAKHCRNLGHLSQAVKYSLFVCMFNKRRCYVCMCAHMVGWGVISLMQRDHRASYNADGGGGFNI